MKILRYIPTYAPAWKFGGPVQSVSRICEGLAARGHDVTVFTTSAGLEDEEGFSGMTAKERNGVRVHYFPVQKGWGIASPALEEAVEKRVKEFELVHISGVWQRTETAACAACCSAGVPYVMSLHGALGGYSWSQKWWKKVPYYFLVERRNLLRASAVHYTSEMEKKECNRFAPHLLSAVIPNPAEIESRLKDESETFIARRNLGVGENEFMFLYVGRLHHKKGLELLVDALDAMSGPPWKMVWVGPDEDGTKGRLMRMATTRNMAERMVFHGQVPAVELGAIYQAADLFCLPSLHENFGNVLLEALSYRCPVLVSDQVGAVDQLPPSRMVSVLPRNVDLWRGEMKRRMEMGRVSEELEWDRLMEQLRSKFSISAVAVQMEQLYERVLGGGR